MKGIWTMCRKILNELTFEIIQKCPNNCIHCSSNSGMSCSEMIKFKVFKQVIDDAIELGMKRLNISGGEPFLHPDLFKMVQYAKKKDIEVFVYTSGIVNVNNKNEAIKREILQQLKHSEVDKLIFNVQAVSDKLYDKIMGTKGCLKFLRDSIKTSTSFKIYTEIHFVPMKINMDNINEVVKFAKEHNVNKISFLKLVLQGRAETNKSLLNVEENRLTEFREYVLNMPEYVNKNIDFRIGVPLSDKNDKSSCSAGWGKLVVKYNGDIIPCEAFKYIEYLNGEEKIYPDNVNENSLMSVWETSKFLNILRCKIHKYCNGEGCSKCPAVKIREKYYNM